ncbi:MAG: hypothetical protein IME97_07865 [Proteobacteria bacterium]|nr:hypothetical protein [Pseudomonadota bacterium]
MDLSVWRDEGFILATMELDHFPAQIIDNIGTDTLISGVRRWQVDIGIFAETFRKTCTPRQGINHHIGLTQSLNQFRNASAYPNAGQTLEPRIVATRWWGELLNIRRIAINNIFGH